MSNPGLLLILGALGVPLLRGWARRALMVVLPVAALVVLWLLPEGSGATIEMLGLELNPLRVDALSRVFATGFLVAAVLTAVFAFHVRDSLQQAVILVYAGTAVGGSLAGDLLTLFVFWELAGLSSVFLIWARRTERSNRAGSRYLVAQVVSGVLMMGGIAVRVGAGEGLEFSYIGLDGPGGALILAAVGIKCAFPVLHAWLTDTYPEATIVGAVALSAFTTKFAVYTLARGFAGTEALVWVGAVMTCFPIFYAVIENDLRRVLAYSMVNQLGFMVVGVGIGGSLGINGAAAHAVADMVFKGLLFMSMGAVLLRTGTTKGSELGGLYKSMPQTTVLCMVGAASISAFPLFSGFATKSLILTAVAEEHRTVIWLMLLFASAGVFHHAGIKIPYFAFFAHDRGFRVAEPPVNMRVAMAMAAAVCVTIGVAPALLYDMLPYAMDYEVFTTAHVINQLQLLLFAALAFTLLVRTGLYPPEIRSVNLDFDAVYRRAVPSGWQALTRGTTVLGDRLAKPLRRRTERLWTVASGPLRPEGRVGAPWSTHQMVWWLALLLGLVLLLALL
ncbi:Na(+)/H(+) antiporter subunit D [Actinophytocola algeriensis]|uniref:Multicomponent Na+:H+ antiporter subunit D n=1 Tax=Actinophytocola algeriensis TaxID=1768010 RepID=A0A7W7Q889_9PSEU|nr:Na(+)/H(+) antiporter subunit D [Actinophytocola algeriensis]MBB4908782.1 multicomponent Na+:H+ antiporter subunit D [Actinophytocola algeriensis]MBE1474831.1 multicomponent Na+:H+ antiporter subunit D [Actinophytocola algeriensis]